MVLTFVNRCVPVKRRDALDAGIPTRRSRTLSRMRKAKAGLSSPVKGHAWGRLYCVHHDRDGCMVSVWSTPRSAGYHARALVRAVDRCPHQDRKEENDEDS